MIMKNTSKKEWLENYATNLAETYGVDRDKARQEAEQTWTQVVSIYYQNMTAMGGKAQGKKNAQNGHMKRIAQISAERRKCRQATTRRQANISVF